MVGTGTARVKLDIIASDASNFSEPIHTPASTISTNPASPSSSPPPNRPTINPTSPPITSAPPERAAIAINEGYFTVQVGAFGARENAEQLKRSLESRYHPIIIQDFPGPNGHLYRVRVGNFQSEDAARDLAAKLAAENGIRPMVVRQDEIAPHGDDRQ
jgi:cell division septation protein DedD